MFVVMYLYSLFLFLEYNSCVLEKKECVPQRRNCCARPQLSPPLKKSTVPSRVPQAESCSGRAASRKNGKSEWSVYGWLKGVRIVREKCTRYRWGIGRRVALSVLVAALVAEEFATRGVLAAVVGLLQLADAAGICIEPIARYV